jgi:hypothetical protein
VAIQQHREYKSPIAALLWSVMMCGFGQFYNGQYIFGTLLLVCEFATNVLSQLNLSILHSFHLNHQTAHDVVDFQWGLFYPATYLFSIWQAYNKAIIINCLQQGEKPPGKTYLTGLFVGMTLGMNFGVFWHHHFLNEYFIFKHLASPVMNGLFLGFLGGITGHMIEKYMAKRKKRIVF